MPGHEPEPTPPGDPLPGPRPGGSELLRDRLELEHLTRSFPDLRQRFRRDALRERLACGPIAILSTAISSTTNRCRMALDGNGIVDLRCFWKPVGTASLLVAVDHDDSIGWLVRVVTEGGVERVWFAWDLALR